MTSSTLPAPVAAYFAAEHNPEALSRCFTPHAVMKDDGHLHEGREAIKSFMAEASAKYGATSVPITCDREEGVEVVRAKVSGNFPGSPIDLSYRFRLERGLIASLEITA
ncbi:nuclear transport factor 2 family protein [Roseateles sp. DC23W]|uniref:Nuclear transport factor 2 family protein n=1 Tax=Pelomonas dachongensis TaxID=3299029 RepID=A0ABW7ER71_9BURK